MCLFGLNIVFVYYVNILCFWILKFSEYLMLEVCFYFIKTFLKNWKKKMTTQVCVYIWLILSHLESWEEKHYADQINFCSFI